MLKNFENAFRGDYGGKMMDPLELKWLCQHRWPEDTGGFWPVQGSLDLTLIAQVYSRVKYDHRQFPYIDTWHNAVLSKPKWLEKCKPKTMTIMALSEVKELKEIKKQRRTVSFKRQPKSAMLAEGATSPPEQPLPRMCAPRVPH